MTLDEIIQRLESKGYNPKRSGSSTQWSSLCPAHNDSNPSLRINEDNGKVLFKCNAGCSFGAVVRALGLKEEDMFQGNKTDYKRTEVIRYEIKDIKGQLIATRCRIDVAHKKKIIWWEQNGTKNLKNGLHAKDLPLYRSEDVPSFSKARLVFLTEGEKDCTALRELKLQALGTVTGAESYPCRQSLEVLKGFSVVLWPDHDAPGYGHMRTIANRLKGIAEKVLFLLPSSPNLKDGAFDWIERSKANDSTPEDMKETLEGAELHNAELPLWEGKEKASPEQPDNFSSTVNSKSEQGSSLDHLAPLGSVRYTLESLEQARESELLSLAELPSAEDGTKAPRYGWGARFNDIIGGGLAPGVLFALGAASAGNGKTALLMQLIDGLALRSALLAGSKEEGPLTPVFILSEMSPEDLNARRLAWLTQENSNIWKAGKTAEKKRGKGLIDGLYNHARRLRAETGTLGRVLSMTRQVERGEVLSLGSQLVPTVRALVNKWRSQLEEKYERDVWPVVVFDPIQRFLRKDKNEIEAQNELVCQIDAASEEEGWLCFVASDTNKSGAKGEASGDAGEVGAALLRGSYALIHGADIACYLGKPEGNKEATTTTIALKFFKNRSGPSFEEVLYHWEKPTGRFKEFSHEEFLEREKGKAEKSTKGKINNGKPENPYEDK